jgi:cobalt-precorrin 5A hydrolase
MRLSVGLGCDRGAALETVRQALQQALAQQDLTLDQITVLASIEAKRDELAFWKLAAQLRRPLRFFSAARLAAVTVPNPSAMVLKHMGTPSVSEAAALLAAGAGMDALLVEKHRWRGADGRHATVSIARMNGDE